MSLAPSQQVAPARAKKSLTRHLIRLHLKMWRRSFKKDWVLIFNAGFMAFFGILGAIGLGAFSYAMLTQEHEARILPLAMAAGALIYLLIVFVWPSPENHLTPQKFATLPVTERQLFPGLTCAAFLQSRALLSIACSLIMAGFGVAGIQASSPPTVQPALRALGYCLPRAGHRRRTPGRGPRLAQLGDGQPRVVGAAGLRLLFPLSRGHHGDELHRQRHPEPG